MDTAQILAQVSEPTVTDHVAKALQTYEAIMRVYAASELRYQAAIQVTAPINGFSTSTSEPAY